MNEIKILKRPSEIFPFTLIYKPSGLPSAPLKENDDCAIFQAVKEIPELLKVKGRKAIEYGLIHRLDTDTEGIILAASTQEAYDFLHDAQKKGKFIKIYIAECKFIENNSKLLGGFPDFPNFSDKVNKRIIKQNIIVSSYFRNYGKKSKEVRPVSENSSGYAINKCGKKKLYETQIFFFNRKGDFTFLAECRIKEGFRHQVRCHLGWCGFPVSGDKLYNSEAKNCNEKLKFKAAGLIFPNPSTGKIEKFYCKMCPEGDLNSYEITLTRT